MDAGADAASANAFNQPPPGYPQYQLLALAVENDKMTKMTNQPQYQLSASSSLRCDALRPTYKTHPARAKKKQTNKHAGEK